VDAEALELHCDGEAHKIVVAKINALMEAEAAETTQVADFNEIKVEKFSV
jgi:hypothetical protein